MKRLFTTLNDLCARKIDKAKLCWLLGRLGKSAPDDAPLSLIHVFILTDFANALLALESVKGHAQAKRRYACFCAQYSLDIFERKFPNDNRPRLAIETTNMFTLGLASAEEMESARNAADEACGQAWDLGAEDAVWAIKAACVVASASPDSIVTEVIDNVRNALGDSVEDDMNKHEDYEQDEVDTVRADALVAVEAIEAVFKREFLRLCRLEGKYGEVD